MSEFTVLSECGDGLGMAIRLQAEGHTVNIWIRDKAELGLGRGLIDAVEKLHGGVIADCTGFGPFLDGLRGTRFQVFAGSAFADKLEEDREFSDEIMEKVGIDTPKSVRVKSRDEAEKFIKRYEKVVIKPEGSLSGVVPSEVAHDSEEAHDILESLEEQYSHGTIQLELQEFVPGIAVSTEGWFNGHEWIPEMFNHTLERKQVLAGDLGDSVGCMGNLVWPCGKDMLVRSTLLKLTEVLREYKYFGPIDINCIVNEEGVFGLEFTPRFGYDAMPTLLYSLCDFNFGEFVQGCSQGELPKVSLKPGFGAGVRLTVPSGDEAKVKIRGLDLEDLQWFYPYCLSFDKYQIQSVGKSGVLGVMNGHGDTPDEAFAAAYERIQRVRVKKLSYRTDLLKVLTKEYNELEQLVMKSPKEWIGFDLDGTLAEYSKWNENIGKPIPEVVAVAQDYIKNGEWVKILTARGSQGSNRFEQLLKIHAFAKEQIGTPLQVTSQKDPGMIVLYDDRVVRVDKGKIYDNIPIRN